MYFDWLELFNTYACGCNCEKHIWSTEIIFQKVCAYVFAQLDLCSKAVFWNLLPNIFWLPSVLVTLYKLCGGWILQLKASYVTWS